MRIRRKLLSLTQEALARQAGVPCEEVRAFEYGDRRAPAAKLEAIARVLGVPVAYFFATFDPTQDMDDRFIATLGQMPATGEGEALAARFPQLAQELRRRLLKAAVGGQASLVAWSA
nr:helix-turn-helix transcriptional regulator [Caulobacter hibisci]